MKTLSKSALKAFNKFLGLAQATERKYVKINNAEGAYLPVSIEILSENPEYKFVAIAHYYEQNGDLLADPSITFAVLKANPEIVFPIEYQQDNLGICRELVSFIDGKPVKYVPRYQADSARFCSMWFKNILQQQKM